MADSKQGRLEPGSTSLKSIRRIVSVFNDSVDKFHEAVRQYQGQKEQDNFKYEQDRRRQRSGQRGERAGLEEPAETQLFGPEDFQMRGMDINIIRILLEKLEEMLDNEK